jgi:ABC-type multidrug transport system ATPase subunit
VVLDSVLLWQFPRGTTAFFHVELGLDTSFMFFAARAFLDEPTANLDPEASKMVRDFILELRKEKRTIFLNTHLLDEAERICDRVGILKTRLLAVDAPEKLRESLWGRKTAVQVEHISDVILAAVKEVASGKVEVRARSRDVSAFSGCEIIPLFSCTKSRIIFRVVLSGVSVLRFLLPSRLSQKTPALYSLAQDHLSKARGQDRHRLSGRLIL